MLIQDEYLTLQPKISKNLHLMKDLKKRELCTKELIKIFLDYDAEYILLKLFTEELAKIKKQSQTTKAYALGNDIDPNLLFVGLNELEPDSSLNSPFFNPFFELFYFHIVGRGKI